MYQNRLARLLRSKSDFLKIKLCLTDENLHKHRLLDSRFGLGKYWPDKLVAPAEGEGTSGAVRVTEGEGPKETSVPKDQSLPQIPSPLDSAIAQELTDEQTIKELSKLPIPEDVYSSQDFGDDPFFSTMDETDAPVQEKDKEQTSLAPGPGLLGSYMGCTSHMHFSPQHSLHYGHSKF